MSDFWSKQKTQFEQEKIAHSLDWTQLSDRALERALAEYNRRKNLAKDLATEYMYDSENLLNLSRHLPVVMADRKHAAKLAAELC